MILLVLDRMRLQHLALSSGRVLGSAMVQFRIKYRKVKSHNRCRFMADSFVGSKTLEVQESFIIIMCLCFPGNNACILRNIFYSDVSCLNDCAFVYDCMCVNFVDLKRPSLL